MLKSKKSKERNSCMKQKTEKVALASAMQSPSSLWKYGTRLSPAWSRDVVLRKQVRVGEVCVQMLNTEDMSGLT
jgi:hypothetical protein